MKKRVIEFLFILLGSAILAAGVGLFFLPNDILSGGVAGISVLLKPFIPIEEDIMVIIIYFILTISSFIFLGKEFTLKTIVSSIAYPLFLLVFTRLMPSFQTDRILATIYGGLLSGIGIGIVLCQGASTGGMDIPPVIIHKYTGFEVAKAIMIIDGFTVLFGLFIYGLEAVLIGLISVYCAGIAARKMTATFNNHQGKQIQIISKEFNNISSAIHTELERGTTIINARGGYTKEERPIVLCVLDEKEVEHCLDIAHRYDKYAFIIVSDINDIHGEGFTYQPRI